MRAPGAVSAPVPLELVELVVGVDLALPIGELSGACGLGRFHVLAYVVRRGEGQPGNASPERAFRW